MHTALRLQKKYIIILFIISALCLLFAISSLNQSTEAAAFDRCDRTIYLKPGYGSLPQYPGYYKPGTSCRYKLIAPKNHNIIVNCTINLDRGPKGCTTEYFYIARDGDLLLRESEYFCHSVSTIRESAFRSIVLAYISGGSHGTFQCQLYTKPQTCDCGWSAKTKVANGEEAAVYEYPSVAALRDIARYPPFYCSAVIISDRFLLTAAHCADMQPNTAYIEAWVGRHNIQSTVDTKYSAIYYINTIIKHPNYQSRATINDIALMITNSDILFSKGVAPICLPPSSNDNDFLYDYVDVVGWGSTRHAFMPSPTLQKATVMVTDNQACSQKHDNITPNHICTHDPMRTKKDSCESDSGGPVIFNSNRQFLAGIISYGKPCGRFEDAIGVNTRVTSYLNWIYQYTRGSTCNVPMWSKS